ncbi:MAG: ABC transporter ATP-binding protein [Candidatus Coatesbacteria bacterium]|nr:MAG: ABC transporter ATP-binding protein [Candidatus Coatesbacteria bacterium]
MAARKKTPAARSPVDGLIELVGVSKVYNPDRVPVHALADVDLQIAAGEYVAIMGPSGSGKSTLMHILGCLDTPTSGSYSLRGQEVSRYTGKKLAHIRNRDVGFVFQRFNLLPRLTAAENVELPLLYARAPADRRREVVADLLAKVGLSDRGHHRPNELSGGEVQRVAIARALANDPAIILADEPTGNLDSKSEDDLMELLDSLNAAGRTLVVVTHEDSVARHAKRVVLLHDGRVV